jgi:hypothetical protein
MSLNVFRCNYTAIEVAFVKILRKYANSDANYGGKKFYKFHAGGRFHKTFFGIITAPSGITWVIT